MLAAYLRFHDTPTSRTFLLLAGAFTLAGLCDWPAYVIVPILCIHFIATRPFRQWPWIVAFGLVACTLFAVLYSYITIATHSSWMWMAPLVARRSAIVGGNHVSWAKWLRAALDFNLTYQTAPVLIISAVWLIAFAFRRQQSRRSTGGSTIARLLFAWAALYAVIGAKALYNHEWAWIPFTPALALATALFVDELLERARNVGHGVARLSHATVAVLVVFFAAWTAYTTFTRLYPAGSSRPFTSIELGQAIQTAAPDRGNIALLVGGDEAEAQLWFYGDRALRTRISSVRDFEQRVHDDSVDLIYNFDEQPWDGRASGIVFPKMFQARFAELHAYLEARYPLTALPPALERNLDVFDLHSERTNPFRSAR